MKKRHFIDNDETAPEEGYSIPVMHMEISRSISEESDLSKSDYYLNKSKDEQGAVYVDEKEEVVEEGSCLKLSSKIRRTDIGTNELYEIECHIDLNSLIEHFVDNELNILKTRGLNDDFKSNEAPGADVVEVVLDNFKEIFSDFSSIIRSERKNLADKIERLHQEGYATFIKTSNDPNHTLSQKSLVKMFYDIAKLKYFQAKLTGEAQYCTDAATYCQYAISIANNVNGLFKDKIESSTHIDSIYNLLTKSYHTLINICSLEPKSFEGIKIDSESIKNFSGKNVFETKRSEVASELCKIPNSSSESDIEYIEKTKSLSEEVTSFMNNYLASLFSEAEKIMGAPPCGYAVAGLGSMASFKITLYSDLEFCIFTENSIYTGSDNQKYKDYFRNISHLVHFKNICLGETIIATSCYGVDLSKYVKQAVNFDLGGKTPLGRIDKPYELIKTKETMLSYIKNFHGESYHIDKNLSNILEKICFVYGKKSLVTEYEALLVDFMKTNFKDSNQLSNFQYSAFTRLKNGINEMLCFSQEISYNKIEGELERFQPSFEYSSSGKIFNVKEDIYRMPDMFIQNLGKFFNVQNKSSFDTLEELKNKGVINEIGALNLQKARCFAINLRSKTYNYYKCQKEKMSSLGDSKEGRSKNVFATNDNDLEVDGPLFQFYYSMIPLYNKLMEICNFIEDNNYVPQDFIKEESFFDNSLFNKINICFRLMQWQKGIDLSEDFFKQSGDKKDVQVVQIKQKMGLILNNLGRHQEALKHREELLEIIKEVTEDAYLIGVCFNNAGYTCNNLGLYREALIYQLLAIEKVFHYQLSVLEKGQSSNKYDQEFAAFTASSHANIGYTFSKLGRYEEALNNLIESLKMHGRLKNENLGSIESCLKNITSVLNQMDQDRKNIYCSKMPAEAKKLLAENHICTDFTYEISSNDCMQCEVNTPLRRSLCQQEKKNTDGYCPAAGTVTQNISSTFKGSHPPMLSRSNKVMEMNSKSLEAINGRSYHQNDPKAVTALNAASYVSSGYAQSKLGKYEEALDSFIESLKIYRSLKDENPKSRKSCLNLITSVFKQMDQDRKNIYCSKMSDEAKNLLADNHIYTDSIDEISSNYCMKGEVNIPLSSSRLRQEKNTRSDYYPAAGAVTDNISSTFPPLLGRGGVSMKMNSKSRELIDKNQILVDQPNHSMGASSEGFIFMGQSSNQNSGAVENNCDPEPEEILSGGCNVFYSYLS